MHPPNHAGPSGNDALSSMLTLDYLNELEANKIEHSVSKYPLPGNLYCTEFSTQKADNNGKIKKRVHCTRYITWHDHKHTRVVKSPRSRPKGGVDDEFSTTLSLVVHLPDFGTDMKKWSTGANGNSTTYHRMAVAMESVRGWNGRPVVLLIHISAETDEDNFDDALHALLKTFQIDPVENLLCAVISGVKFNRRAMLNMVNDAVQTRFVLTNVNPDKGQKIIASETLSLVEASTRKLAKKEKPAWGIVLLLPHFHLKLRDPSNGSAEGLIEPPPRLARLVKMKEERSDALKLYDDNDYRTQDCWKAVAENPVEDKLWDEVR